MKKGILLSMFLMNILFNVCAANTSKPQERITYTRAELAEFMEAMSSRAEVARSWIQGFGLAGLVIGLCRPSERQDTRSKQQKSSSIVAHVVRLGGYSVAGAVIGLLLNQGLEALGDYLDDERAEDSQVKKDDQFVDSKAQRGWQMARALSATERLIMPFQREQDHRKLFFKIKKNGRVTRS
jgi:hypothetical protein